MKFNKKHALAAVLIAPIVFGSCVSCGCTGKHIEDNNECEKGEPGKDGRSVVSIAKTATNGLVDTYTIYYSDGTTSTFDVTNGEHGSQGIQGNPGKDGHTPVITIGADGCWIIDGTTTGIKAKGENGDDGRSIINITKTSSEGLLDTYTIYYSDNSTSTFVIANGTQGEQGVQGVPGKDGHTPEISINDQGYWIVDGVQLNIKAKGDKGDNGESAYDIYCKTHPDYKKSETEWLDDLVNGRLGNKVKHTVTFETGTEEIIESQTVEHGEKISKPINPIREGYIFNGWFYQGEKWSFIGYVVTEDITLVADWTLNEYKVTINYNNDKGTVIDNYHFNDTISLENPTKVNYNFIEWQNGDGQKVIFPLTVNSDLTLNAIYSNEVKFVFDSNGGHPVDDMTYIIGSTNNTLPIPTHDSGVFKGWYYLKDGIDTKLNNNFTNTFNEGLSLKAHWDILDDNFDYTANPDGSLKVSKYKGNDLDVIVPNAVDGKLITKIGSDAFTNNTSIKSVKIGDNVELIEPGCFEGCTSLGTVNFGVNVKNYGNCLLNLNNLTEVVITNNIELIKLFGNQEKNIPISLTDIKVKKGNNIVETLADKLFKSIITKRFNVTFLSDYCDIKNNELLGLSCILSIKVEDGIKSIGLQAFSLCKNLNSVILPESLETLGHSCFYNDTSLTEINIPSKIHNLDNSLFYGCSSLRSINLPDTLVSIGNSAFKNCISLNINQLPISLENIESNAFEGCKSITEITISNTIKTISDYAFKGCTSLNAINYLGTKEQFDLINISEYGIGVDINIIKFQAA